MAQSRLEYMRKWRRDHREQINARMRYRYATEPEFRQMFLENNRKHKHDPVAQRFSTIKHHYGLTLDGYHALLERQNEQCPLCLVVLDPVGLNTVVDHNHSTGKIRGLLCRRCNNRLWWYEDVVRDRVEKYLGGN